MADAVSVYREIVFWCFIVNIKSGRSNSRIAERAVNYWLRRRTSST